MIYRNIKRNLVARRLSSILAMVDLSYLIATACAQTLFNIELSKENGEDVDALPLPLVLPLGVGAPAPRAALRVRDRVLQMLDKTRIAITPPLYKCGVMFAHTLGHTARI